MASKEFNSSDKNLMIFDDVFLEKKINVEGGNQTLDILIFRKTTIVYLNKK